MVRIFSSRIGIACVMFAVAAAGLRDIATAGTLPLPRVTARVSRGAIRVDGRLNESDWRRAARVVLKENQAGEKSRQRTTVLILRDAGHLYIGFECNDTQALATLTQRDDNLWREECVEIFFDPTGEGRRYLEIEVNPLGTVFDAWINFGPDIDFDAAKAFNFRHLQVATGVLRRWSDPPKAKERGWTCEIAIPLSELPDAPGPNARINFARIDRLDGKHVYDAWSPTYKWFHAPERFGWIRFR